MSIRVFQEIMAYLYTGVARITYELIGKIAELAHFLGLEWLYQQCISIIRQKEVNSANLGSCDKKAKPREALI